MLSIFRTEDIDTVISDVHGHDLELLIDKLSGILLRSRIELFVRSKRFIVVDNFKPWTTNYRRCPWKSLQVHLDIHLNLDQRDVAENRATVVTNQGRLHLCHGRQEVAAQRREGQGQRCPDLRHGDVAAVPLHVTTTPLRLLVRLVGAMRW